MVLQDKCHWTTSPPHPHRLLISGFWVFSSQSVREYMLHWLFFRLWAGDQPSHPTWELQRRPGVSSQTGRVHRYSFSLMQKMMFSAAKICVVVAADSVSLLQNLGGSCRAQWGLTWVTVSLIICSCHVCLGFWPAVVLVQFFVFILT